MKVNMKGIGARLWRNFTFRYVLGLSGVALLVIAGQIYVQIALGQQEKSFLTASHQLFPRYWPQYWPRFLAEAMYRFHRLKEIELAILGLILLVLIFEAASFSGRLSKKSKR